MSIENFLLFEAEGKAVAALGNELKFDNFIEQGQRDNILVLKKDCSIKKMGWFGSSLKIDNTYLNNAYLVLFDYLVKKEIIKEKVGIQMFFTADYVYTINKEFVESKIIKEKIKSTNEDFPKLLHCYTIEFDKLSNFLKNYTYNALDEYNLVPKLIQPNKVINAKTNAKIATNKYNKVHTKIKSLSKHIPIKKIKGGYTKRKYKMLKHKN